MLVNDFDIRFVLSIKNQIQKSGGAISKVIIPAAEKSAE